MKPKFLLCFLLVLSGGFQNCSLADSPENTNAMVEPVVYFDLSDLFTLDLKDERQRQRFWDETHLVVTLQGLVNRDRPLLFIRYMKDLDDFWWKQMTTPDGWLAGREIVHVNGLDQLLAHFRSYYRGIVVWDERVPSTSNLASTIAGCDDLLAVRFDPDEGSLYRRLTEGKDALPVKVLLMRDDGSPLFTGTGIIPDTSVSSSGSAKCDAYLWLIEHYIKTGKTNPRCLGFYLDAFWLKCWNAWGPDGQALANHDFIIAHRGVIFDLDVWDDEAPVDDPRQRPGTDVATLRKLFRAAYNQFNGNGVIEVPGFIPWAYKYTTQRCPEWFAGGHHEGVPTEWHYASILSCFNAFMDGDALGLNAMPNASFYQHYPLAPNYPQNPKPTQASLTARGLLDAKGQVVPHAYVAFYVGDYDSSAWLYHMLPSMWSDPGRGSTPLSWAFNPNLSGRFPLGMAWARERSTTNDWFVAGDSGAGYINPSYLTPPRPQSGLPSGLAAWENHCERFFKQWDLTLTGFIIDGEAPGLSPAGLDAYSHFSPDGIIEQKISRQGVHNGMPYLRMAGDLDGSPADVARSLSKLPSGPSPGFFVFRTILKTPTWHAGVEKEVQSLMGDKIKFVDLYTLLWLVHEYETNEVANARELTATPDQSEGLAAIYAADGQFTIAEHDGKSCWFVPRKASSYFYFGIDGGFRPRPGEVLEIELEYLDIGSGEVGLDYDSRDLQAPLAGAYKHHSFTINRANSGQWRKASFRLNDARFNGSQNEHADFRFYNGGDELVIRSVRVRRVAGSMN